jgi:hypothetical protein
MLHLLNWEWKTNLIIAVDSGMIVVDGYIRWRGAVGNPQALVSLLLALYCIRASFFF